MMKDVPHQELPRTASIGHASRASFTCHALYSLAVLGALAIEPWFSAKLGWTISIATAVFALGILLHTIQLGVLARGLQLVGAFAIMFLGVFGERPASLDVTFFSFVFIMLSVCGWLHGAD